MSIVLYNPTNEDFESQYVGETVKVEGELLDHYDAEGKWRPAKCKVRVDDARGRHILNAMDNRGLVTLEYGDEGEGEERKAAEGRKRNEEFKFKQVIDFNTLNEQRFQSKLPYITPRSHIKNYADELGIELRQPYAVEDAARRDIKEAKAKEQQLKLEIKAKDEQLAEMQDQMSELMSQVKTLMAAVGAKAEKSKVADSIAGKWATMGAKVLGAWVQKNWEQVSMLPDKDFEDLNERFEKVYGKKLPAQPDDLAKIISKAA